MNTKAQRRKELQVAACDRYNLHASRHVFVGNSEIMHDYRVRAGVREAFERLDNPPPTRGVIDVREE